MSMMSMNLMNKGYLHNPAYNGLNLIQVIYAESKYEKLKEKSTEVVQRYFQIHVPKKGFLDGLDWFFNDKRRAVVAAAKRVLLERGRLESKTE